MSLASLAALSTIVVDLVFASWGIDDRVLDRAEVMSVGAARILVAAVEELFAMKVLSYR